MPRGEGEGGGPGQRSRFISVKEAATHKNSLRVGGNPMNPRLAPRGREGARWVPATSGFSRHLHPSLLQTGALGKPTGSRESWSLYILIITNTLALQQGWGREWGSFNFERSLEFWLLQLIFWAKVTRGFFFYYYLRMTGKFMRLGQDFI